MTRFAILLGGQLKATARVKRQVRDCRVIAADGGIAHAAALGIQPELWVGDFDSSSEQSRRDFAHIPSLQFPAEKNATDGDIAVSEAFRRGATEIVLVGGFGGQFDHTLAHATMLLALARRDIPCMMTSGHEEAYPLTWQMQITGLLPGTRISIVPASDIKGLTLDGVKWPLTNSAVPFGSTLTLSNQTTGDVSISMHSGAGLVIAYPQED